MFVLFDALMDESDHALTFITRSMCDANALLLQPQQFYD